MELEYFSRTILILTLPRILLKRQHMTAVNPPPSSSTHTAPSSDEVRQLITLFKQGRYPDVETHAREIMVRFPHHGFAWKALGAIMQIQGRCAESLEYMQKAVILLPLDAEAQYNLGVTLKGLDRISEAEASFRRALELKPDYAEAYFNLGLTLHDLGRFTSAKASYHRALEIKPDFAEAYNNLGNTFKELGEFKEAEAGYRRALKIKPDYVEAYNNLGNILRHQGRLEESEASCRHALEIKPDYVEAHGNLGSILKDQGRLHEAETCFRRALEIRPDFAGAQSNLLYCLNYSQAHSASYRLEEGIRYGRMVTNLASEGFGELPCKPEPERLRVGMVSGDFMNHPVGYFLENLLARIDRSSVELIAFPTCAKTDELTARIKPFFVAWKPLYGLNDEAAARRIHSEGIHILLDLSGHTAHNRLPVFAWKPAPIQVSWLGYVATTGVEQMDYILTDEMRVPPAHQGHFTERIWYLPDTRLCFSPPDVDLPVQPLPAQANGFVTFACFQNLSKISDSVLKTWASIMAILPTARLRLQCKQLADGFVRQRSADRLKDFGIDSARVAMYGPVPRMTYLAAYAEVDMNLDTFPFPGVTTTCEAIWSGVPTVTLAGDNMAARSGASVMSAAGLADWVAASEDEYVTKAVTMASDLPKLAVLRSGLREQALASPLFDSVRFARNFEAALWGMWHHHSKQ